MATETAASDHASTTDEQYVKKEKNEAIAEAIASLANEDEVKHDKPEDTPSSKTEEDDVKAELAAFEVKISDDSPALDASAEDQKVEDTQSVTLSTGGDVVKVEPAVAVEKTEDSVPSDSSVAVEDNVKKEKELVPDGVTEPVHDAANGHPDEAPATETNVEETPPQQIEKEIVETDEENKQVQPETQGVPEASAETTEKPSDTDEIDPLIKSEGEVVKEAQVLETSAEVEEKPESVATHVQEETIEAEKELQETEQPTTVAVDPPTESEGEVVKEVQVLETSTPVEEKPEPVATQEPDTNEPEKELQEAEQPITVAVSEPSVEAAEKPNYTIEEKVTEPSADVVEETKINEAEPVVTEVDQNQEPGKTNESGPTDTVEAEQVVTEVDEKQGEPEKQSLEQKKEEEKPDTSAIPEHSGESSDAVEVKSRELEFEAEVLKETETEKTEPVVAKVDENQIEPEKQAEEEQPKPVVPEAEAESAEQHGSIVESHPPKDSDTEVVKDTDNSETEAVPEKIEIPEPVSTEVEEKPREQLQVGDEVLEVSKDVEEVKETTNSELEAVPGEIEKPEPLSTEVEEKPSEQLQVGEESGEASKEVETKREILLETSKSEETSDDTVKEEKTDKEEETSLTENAAQVSSNEEPQAGVVEPSPEVAEKIVEEDNKKETSVTNAIEAVSNEVASIIKTPEQTSIDQEAKTDIKDSVPAAVEEKVDVTVAANDDDKKEPEAPNVVPGSSTEQEVVEGKKVEEQNEAKTATTEAVESVKDDKDISAVEDKKEEKSDTKVEEISRAVSEPVRETLASKFEENDQESVETGENKLEKEQNVEPEKTEVQATKESDVTKTSKDLPKETPAKPAQKQSNNIISKVKQSLVKAKKAITGKSPSSKNLSSEPKGDIKVK